MSSGNAHGFDEGDRHNLTDAPEELLCPIGGVVMLDPVLCGARVLCRVSLRSPVPPTKVRKSLTNSSRGACPRAGCSTSCGQSYHRANIEARPLLAVCVSR